MDVSNMVEIFRDLEFEVQEKPDLTKDEMEFELKNFLGTKTDGCKVV